MKCPIWYGQNAVKEKAVVRSVTWRKKLCELHVFVYVQEFLPNTKMNNVLRDITQKTCSWKWFLKVIRIALHRTFCDQIQLNCFMCMFSKILSMFSFFFWFEAVKSSKIVLTKNTNDPSRPSNWKDNCVKCHKFHVWIQMSTQEQQGSYNLPSLRLVPLQLCPIQ